MYISSLPMECRFFLKINMKNRLMTKTAISILVLFASIFFYNPAIAATAEELAARIAQLQEQLAAIQARNATNGNLSGTVENPVILGVTQITAVKTYATADGSFENGWQWVFDVTVPANETILKMKFADWVNGSNIIPATNNIRFYSAQSTNANNAGSAIIIAGAGEYSAGLNINPANTSDLDLAEAGRQIRITMETRVPTGSAGGSYATSYGINTEVDPDVIVSGQGDIIVTTNPTPADNTRVYEGDNKVAVYSMKIKASGSNMDIQSVTLKFSKQPYSYFSKLYLYDGDTQIASTDLNSSTVLMEASEDYRINLTSFISKFIVANDTYKALTVKADVLAEISSGLLVDGIANVIIANPNITSICAVDGLGLNHYGGDIIGRTISVSQSQSTNATLAISLSSNTPQSRNIIADTNSDISGATLLIFDLKASKDTLSLDEVNNVAFAISDGYKLPSTAYLVDDAGAVIATATPNQNGIVNFTDLNYLIIKDTTKTFAIKVDDIIASNGSDDGKKYQVLLNGVGIATTKSNGAELADDKKSGSAQSNDAFIYAKGPVFTLASITTTNTQATEFSSSTISAAFNIQIQAVSGDVYIPKTAAFVVDYEINGVDIGAVGPNNTIYTQPSGTVSGSNAYKIADGTSAIFVVSATKLGDDATYDLRVSGIKWGLTNIAATDAGIKNSNYMADDSWISPAVYLR